MTSSTNFSGNRFFLKFCLPAVLLSGCAVAPAVMPMAERVPLPLTIGSVTPDKGSPQAAEMATLRWRVEAEGGAGERMYSFRLTDGNAERVVQEGPSATWTWFPTTPGTYRVKAAVRDSLGNGAESGWSPEYKVEPMLEVFPVISSKGSPQAAEMATVRWTAKATGGVGERSYTFRLSDGKGEKVVQEGTSAAWSWTPAVPGTYRVKVAVRDGVGNEVENGWSPEYTVVPKLAVSAPSPAPASPQVAGTAPVRWKVDTSGGVGDRTVEFRTTDGTEEKPEQVGPSASWDWFPRDPGIFRVKAIVRDAIGNVAESGWSPEYRIDFPAGMNSLIAVMPVENLAGMPVDVHAVQRSLVQDLKRKGLGILGDEALEKFLERHRVRYTGGMNRDLAKALRKETGANAALFPFLELFDDSAPPKVALGARLVSTDRAASILWTGSTGIAGNDAPGFLLLGLINDPAALLDKARGTVADSLVAYLSGKPAPKAETPGKRFLPKSFRGVPPKMADGAETRSIAVLPFRNESSRRNAGEILALQFLGELTSAGNVDVVEPGEVRQVLLRSRTIMEGGLSLPQAAILHAELEVDLVLTGIVTEYQDAAGGFGNPKVEFSVRVFDANTRQVVWSSYSYNQGDDGAFFFNLGKVNTAHGTAAKMVRSTVREMEAAFRSGEPPLAAASHQAVR